MIFAHAFLGLIIGYIFTIKPTKSNLYTKQKRLLIIFVSSIIGSIFPDFDFVFAFLLHNKELHRHLLTHSLLLYFLIIFGFFIIKYFKNYKNETIDTLWIRTFWAFTVGAIVHLFADFIATPVYLFEPLINRGFVLVKFHAKETEGLRKYVFSPYMLNEIGLIILGVILLILRFKNYKKELIILLGLIGIILLSAIIVLIPYF